MKEIYDHNRYMVIDRETGEELDLSIFIDRISANGWERAYARVIADYINCAGDKSSQLLAWILRNRDANNLIHGTFEEITKKSGVSISVTKKIIKRLYEKNLLKKVRSGCYIVTPKMIRNGNNTAGAIIIRTWDETIDK